MKQIAVTIPDNKEALFIELMKNLSFVKKIESLDSADMPDWHKAVIDQRMDAYRKKPNSFRDWDELQKEIDGKYGL